VKVCVGDDSGKLCGQNEGLFGVSGFERLQGELAARDSHFKYKMIGIEQISDAGALV
jgi:hypothetical protein